MSETRRRRPLWLRLAGLAVLLLLLLGLNSLYDSVIRWQPVLSGQPGNVLYASGFDGFTSEWERYSGRLSAQIEDGVMRIDVGDVASIPYSAASPVFGDFDARVSATVVDGSAGNDGYGLIFRLQENLQDKFNDCDMPMILLCDLAQIDLLSVPLNLMFRQESQRATGFYMFLISNDGYYKLWRSDAAGGANEITPWMQADVINLGLETTNRIRVVGRGDTFQFYINGERMPLCIPDPGNAPTLGLNGECLGGTMRESWQDDRLASGRIGLVVRTEMQAGTVVEFDNFVVLSPTLERERVFPQT